MLTGTHTIYTAENQHTAKMAMLLFLKASQVKKATAGIINAQ